MTSPSIIPTSTQPWSTRVADISGRPESGLPESGLPGPVRADAGPIEVRELGTVDYRDAYDMQHRLAEELSLIHISEPTRPY